MDSEMGARAHGMWRRERNRRKEKVEEEETEVVVRNAARAGGSPVLAVY